MIKVATDAGGTFTDLVAFEETSGQIYVGKALTTPKDPSQGVIHSIAQSRERLPPGPRQPQRKAAIRSKLALAWR